MSRVKLGDVAQEYKATVKDCSNLPIVGLEHLTPGEITLERWDEGTENTFTKGFKKGQMLFGRRRAYLKKAAVAPFDGVCSGDITVIEAIPGKILPELLPFIIQNDLLFDYAVGKSAGSLSPRVKWVDLKDYEFELPEIEKQTSLVDLLKAAHATRKAYQEQIKATADLVKSQFIEMFGGQEENPYGYPSVTLGEVCSFFSGTGFPNEYQGNQSGKYPFFKVGDISRNVQNGNKQLQDCDNYIDDDVVPQIHGAIIPEGTVVFAKIGEALRLNRRAITSQNCLIDNNAMGIKPDSKLTLGYFFQYMQLLDMGKYAGATAMPSVRKSTLENVQILIPPTDKQMQFEQLMQQSDKSKFELQQAIEKVDNLIKSLIQQDNK